MIHLPEELLCMIFKLVGNDMPAMVHVVEGQKERVTSALRPPVCQLQDDDLIMGLVEGGETRGQVEGEETMRQVEGEETMGLVEGEETMGQVVEGEETRGQVEREESMRRVKSHYTSAIMKPNVIIRGRQTTLFCCMLVCKQWYRIVAEIVYAFPCFYTKSQLARALITFNPASRLSMHHGITCLDFSQRKRGPSGTHKACGPRCTSCHRPIPNAKPSYPPIFGCITSTHHATYRPVAFRPAYTFGPMYEDAHAIRFDGLDRQTAYTTSSTGPTWIQSNPSDAAYSRAAITPDTPSFLTQTMVSSPSSRVSGGSASHVYVQDYGVSLQLYEDVAARHRGTSDPFGGTSALFLREGCCHVGDHTHGAYRLPTSSVWSCLRVCRRTVTRLSLAHRHAYLTDDALARHVVPCLARGEDTGASDGGLTHLELSGATRLTRDGLQHLAHALRPDTLTVLALAQHDAAAGIDVASVTGLLARTGRALHVLNLTACAWLPAGAVVAAVARYCRGLRSLALSRLGAMHAQLQAGTHGALVDRGVAHASATAVWAALAARNGMLEELDLPKAYPITGGIAGLLRVARVAPKLRLLSTFVAMPSGGGRGDASLKGLQTCCPALRRLSLHFLYGTATVPDVAASSLTARLAPYFASCEARLETVALAYAWHGDAAAFLGPYQYVPDADAAAADARLYGTPLHGAHTTSRKRSHRAVRPHVHATPTPLACPGRLLDAMARNPVLQRSLVSIELDAPYRYGHDRSCNGRAPDAWARVGYVGEAVAFHVGHVVASVLAFHRLQRVSLHQVAFTPVTVPTKGLAAARRGVDACHGAWLARLAPLFAVSNPYDADAGRSGRATLSDAFGVHVYGSVLHELRNYVLPFYHQLVSVQGNPAHATRVPSHANTFSVPFVHWLLTSNQ